MSNLISTFIKNSGLHIKNCIGNSIDGAANMRGQYNGFTSWLSKESPGQIHVWCYAHVLNLVVTDATSSVIEGTSLFQLLNSCAVFLRESYQRMDVWENTSVIIRYQRLNVIGETRWSAKETALKKFFGHYDNKETSLYVDLLITLNYFVSNVSFNAQIRHTASTLMESLLRFKVILTAHIYLKIFQYIGPLSKYLQTSNLDYLTAYNMVTSTLNSLKKFSRDFSNVKEKSNSFAKRANTLLEEENCEIIVEEDIPEVRFRRRKRMPDKITEDHEFQNPIEKYKITTFNVIMDTTINTIENRFKNHGKLYADMAILDPKNFTDNKCSENSLKYHKTATASNLREEGIN
ncbi:uncharacterized protein LOC136086319 [Hydra vulgaris]|uniref:Uncharacterized protein LOC136086319 n=1 Tax=Hydra vulgaris TaxID=6087 RepID=A0ABM4CS11_HYDVU